MELKCRIGVGIETATIDLRPKRYWFPDVHPAAESNHWIDPINRAGPVATWQQCTVKAQIPAHVIVTSTRIEGERYSFTIEQAITDEAFRKG